MNRFFSFKKSKNIREQHIFEAYRTIEVQRDALKSYVWSMKLLTKQEHEIIMNEIHRLNIWLVEKTPELTMEFKFNHKYEIDTQSKQRF